MEFVVGRAPSYKEFVQIFLNRANSLLLSRSADRLPRCYPPSTSFLQSVLFCITSPRTLILRWGDVESVAQGEGNTARIIVLHLTEQHAITVEREAVDGTIEKVIA